MVSFPFHNSSGTFCTWIKALTDDLSAELIPPGVGWRQSRDVSIEVSGRLGLQTLTLVKTEVVHFVRIPCLRQETLFHDSDPCRFANRIKLFLTSWNFFRDNHVFLNTLSHSSVSFHKMKGPK